jgi:hypothetical protein
MNGATQFVEQLFAGIKVHAPHRQRFFDALINLPQFSYIRL